MVRLGSVATGGGRRCAECGQPFTARRHDQLFCTGPCRFDDHNRAMKRGREAYRAMYHWRLGQGKGQRGSLIGTISAMAKQWVEEDKAAGRQPPPLPEELVTRRQNARTGYVRVTGAARKRNPAQQGYVKDLAKAERVLEELA